MFFFLFSLNLHGKMNRESDSHLKILFCFLFHCKSRKLKMKSKILPSLRIFDSFFPKCKKTKQTNKENRVIHNTKIEIVIVYLEYKSVPLHSRSCPSGIVCSPTLRADNRFYNCTYTNVCNLRQ